MNSTQANSSRAEAAAHPTCILLVEDNPGDADLIRVLLRRSAELSTEILSAETLAAATEILASRPVQAVLLDLNLPDSSGIATVQAVCQASPLAPVVVLTGNNDKETGLAAVQAGAQDFLAKGTMTGEAIWRVLRYAVERQRSQAEIAESRRFLQASLDALSARVVIVGQDGCIRFANRAWRESVRERGLGELEAEPSYLSVCSRIGAENPAQIAALEAGIRAVGSGAREHFSMEYCCRQPGETFWFQVRVTRFPAAGGDCVAVAHEDITQLKTVELRETRLASVLRGVRNVNQLITKEDDPQRLIQSACENLTGTMSYLSAWIALLAEEGEPLVGSAGLAQDGRELLDRLLRQDYPHCMEQAVRQPGVASILRTAPECEDCSLGACVGRHLLARLEFDGHVFGVMAVTAPDIVTDDPEEQELFAELVDDIAFALHKIRLADGQRKAEEALLASEQRYRTLFENAPVGIFTTNQAGRALQVNPAMAQMLGCASPGEACARYGDLARQLYADPQRREQFLELLRRDGEVRAFEYQAQSTDGRPLWLSMNARIAGQEQDGGGRIEGFASDVTQRKLAEERLQESERLYRLLADNTIDCIWLMTLDRTFQYVNPAVQRLLGYSPDEVVGTKLERYCDPENLLTFQTALTAGVAILPRIESTTMEARLLRRDGRPVDIELVARIIVDEEGQAMAVQGMARDISERIRIEEEKARLEEQIQRNQRLESIGRLAGGVAHDLNNLLSPILGYTELLLDDPATSAHCRECLGEIAHAGDRARDLVAQLLAFGRRQLLEFRAVDLNDILNRFGNLLRRAIREDVEIVFLPAPALPLVQADAGQLEQVVMNLAVNAQDAMPQGGILTIETAVAELDEEYARTHEGITPGNYAMLAVSDTGAGMDTVTAARIFEPFFTTKEKGKGTGLGLATVYGIVRQHGGCIWVYSEPQRGATFKVYLPVSAQAASATDPSRSEPPPARGAGVVLLVEDNEQVKGLAQAVLKRQGYTVLAANNGREALQLIQAREGNIDLLLTDVVMPEISGRELYDRMAEVFPRLKVLYMSGYTDNVIAHQGIIEPGVSFLQKPFSIKALADKVSHLLSTRQA